MNLLDYIILIILILSALLGFKKGFISSVVAFAGTLLVIIIAFYLKNPISNILYEHLPFFSLGGKFAGMSIVNILIYEAISYIITLTVLGFILGIVVKISGIFNKLVHATVVLTLPSKLLGALCGFVEGLVISFILVFVLGLISPLSSIYNNSKYADTLLEKTPVLSSIVGDTYKSVVEIYDVAIKNENKENKEEANADGLNILLKYEIITPDSANKLLKSGKIKINGAEEIINNYNKEGNV